MHVGPSAGTLLAATSLNKSDSSSLQWPAQYQAGQNSSLDEGGEPQVPIPSQGAIGRFMHFVSEFSSVLLRYFAEEKEEEKKPLS